MLSFAAALTIALAACQGGRDGATVQAPAGLDAEAQEYVRLADALGERDRDSIDFYSGAADWVSGIRSNPPALDQIRSQALDLLAHLQSWNPSNAEEAKRRTYLAAQSRAIAARVDVLKASGEDFDRETMELFGVSALRSFDETLLLQVRSELSALLGGGGDLAERYARYNTKFVIPPARLPAVMAAAIEGCRRQTLAHLQLPPGEGVTVEYVSDKPWAGYSTYQGHYHSVIQINRDLGLGPDDVLTLACHEGYPGHHAFNSVRDWRGHGWPEVTVQSTFSPQSLLSEGAATNAPDLAFPPAERVQFERNRLFPVAGLDAADAANYVRAHALVDRLHDAEAVVAREYLLQQLEFVRAEQALSKQALMAEPSATLLYLNEYRSYVVTYTVGRDMVKKCIESNSAEVKWSRYYELMEDPDTLLPCVSR